MRLWIDWTGYEAGTFYRYEWYNPSGDSVFSYQNNRNNDSDGCSWGSITPQKLWENGSGEWTVKFYYDDVLYFTGTFLFEDPGDFEYLSYQPESFEAGNGILIAVHSASYNPVDYYHLCKPMADSNGVMLLVPYFSEADWLGYNKLFTETIRADTQLIKMIDTIVMETGADSTTLYLYGHSSGGQFVHRYLFAHPENVHRALMSAPGWWTFPREDWLFPFGIGYTEVVPDEIEFDLDAINAVQKKVIVGEFDTLWPANLEFARFQGIDRQQKAAHWVNRMSLYSFENSLEHSVRYEIISNVGHHNMGTAAFAQIEAFLFDDYPAPDVLGSIQINEDMDTTTSLTVDLFIQCQAAEGCGQIAIDTIIIGDNYENYFDIEWDGLAGEIQTASIPYTFENNSEEVKFISCRIKDSNGNTSDISGDVIIYQETTAVENKQTDTDFIFRNYPNPFQQTTQFRYDLPKSALVSLSVYNLSGQLVETIINIEQPDGKHTINWNVGDLDSGMYFYQLTVNQKVVARRKMILLK